MSTADSCTAKHVIIGTEQFDRVPYHPDYGPQDQRCHDCNILRGGLHHPGCDMERCPGCHGQAIACDCDEPSYIADAVYTLHQIAVNPFSAIGFVWYARVQYQDHGTTPYLHLGTQAPTLEECRFKMRTLTLNDGMKVLGYIRVMHSVVGSVSA